MQASGVYASTTSGTKHSTYQLPGGEDYGELLLTLPVVDKTYMNGYAKFKNLD